MLGPREALSKGVICGKKLIFLVFSKEREELAQKEINSAPLDLLNFTRLELAEDLKSRLGLEPYRAQQLTRWVFRRRVTDFSVMTDISRETREALGAHYGISRPETRLVQQSKDGTRKYLFGLQDGKAVETVLVRQPSRWTLCVSSQVGCPIGCAFCRTGLMGFQRNLSVAEIVGQVLAVKDDMAALAARESSEFPANTHSVKAQEVEQDFVNIVFMGMGEPLHNLENVIKAVCILNDNQGLNYSSRKITVSTSGLVPAIKKFGESKAGANLALSLNATTDAVRSRLIPINRKWPLSELLAALRGYPLKKGRRITIEYVLLGGINDSPEDLCRLPKLLHGIPVKVNLIPYNGSAALGFMPPEISWVHHWQKALLDAGINSTIRWSKGADINAACGQLADLAKP